MGHGSELSNFFFVQFLKGKVEGSRRTRCPFEIWEFSGPCFFLCLILWG